MKPSFSLPVLLPFLLILPLTAQTSSSATAEDTPAETGAAAESTAAPAPGAEPPAPATRTTLPGFDENGQVQPIEVPDDLLLTYDPANPTDHLNPEHRQTLTELQASGGELMRQQRFSDASFVFIQALRLAPDEPSTLNALGACYVQLRDFASATAIFEQILKNKPGNWQARFNLAEMYFVQDEYAKALASFKTLNDGALPKEAAGTGDLLNFKIYLCLLQTGAEEEAIELSKQYDAYSSSPVWYMMNAALDFSRKNETAAQGWVSSASRVFPPAALLVYLDSFVEIGWIDSVNG